MKMIIQAYVADERRPIDAERLYTIARQLQKEHEAACSRGFKIYNDFGRLLLGSKIIKSQSLVILEAAAAEKAVDKLYFYDLAARETIVLRLA